MSIETNAVEESNRVEELGRELGDAITELPEYAAFEAAKEAVEESASAQEKIDEFERVRREFALARQTGSASQEDMDHLQEVQEDLHSIPVMADYLEAKEELADRLEAVNEAISEPLAVDFGGEAGGCCHD